ncbi:MAG: starch-binding protein [Alistipes sp.]|nr:starch-binding protein [Alistipes sp.]
MKKLLSILALALCFVACQNEGVENASNGGLANVVLTVDAPELGATRADADANAGRNSAFGAIDFFNDADWANYDLRYTLEVYDANDDGTGEPIYRERLVNYLDKYAPTTFDLRLVPNREYKFVVFADFVEQGSKDDLYYDTTDLRNITAKTGAEGWNAMNEVRDAYFVSENVEVSTSLTKTLTLTRPFGKVRVIATDLDYIAGYSAPGYVEVTYHTEALYKSFNAINGQLNATPLAGNELVYGFEVKKNAPYTEGYDAEAKNQTLFADYLFARESQQMPINFKMAVYESKGGRLIKETDFNTQIPVQRNYLTTITGDILTTQANITIVVNDDFVDEMINPSMEVAPAAPVATATAEGNTVTLTWEAVEGAVKYFAGIAGQGAEETTELTKVYENLAWETEYTFVVYAMSEKGLVGETTEVKATTGVKPAEYKLYLENADNWEKVCVYAWDAEGAHLLGEWPGTEMTEKETVNEVEYFVYTLSSELNGQTINFNFNNGNNGKQTADIEGVVVNDNYFYTNYVEPAQPSGLTLYLQPNANWKVDDARFAAYFFGAGETWVDMTLVEGETDIYSVEAPAGYPNVIFCRMNPGASANNWNNKWNQTGDLKVPTDDKVLFVVPANSWDGATNGWTTYVVAEPEPEVLATPVVKASVEGNVVTLTWAAVEGAANYTVQVDDDVEETVNATTYVFEGDYEVEYTFTVKAIAADTTKNTNSEAAVVTATTEAKPVVGPAEPVLTVAEFLALTDVVPSDATAEEIAAAPRYTLTGTITSCPNTTYGNFYLNDGTGEVLIYGLVGPNGETKYWATSGAKVGDDITVKTIRTEYSNAPQGKNATFVEVKSPGTLAFWSFEATSASFTAAADAKDIEVTIYNSTADVVATSDNAQFSATYANGVLTVSARENTSSDPIEGNITVTCGTLSQVITVSQLGASSGDQTAVEATISFADKANRTTYTTSQQVWEQNGITVTNDKSSSTSNVGDYYNPARFYKSSDVKIEAPGAILSISINVSGLESKYVTPWGTADNGIVTITLDGTSNTYEIKTLSAQARAYSMTVTYLK